MAGRRSRIERCNWRPRCDRRPWRYRAYRFARLRDVGDTRPAASAIAAASPTPGGLGATEAALIAGLTGVGLGSGPAVSAVLTYRLATYWLPVAPGWIALHLLQRRDYV